MSPQQVAREDGAGEDSGREGNVVCLMIANSEGVACQLIRGFLATHAPTSSVKGDCRTPEKIKV